MPKKCKSKQVRQVVNEEDRERFKKIKADSEKFEEFVKKANKNLETKDIKSK